ncbi:THAP domain-containing protein 9 [Aphis craccivora]|uniref:THAP domain-containing protein 9 n=1 Tax=Aphis craccivora TaxID=307492 RepID=A0A6G0YLK5_APHCR|nr:THAP domain-containing protein 9 [Aphis craccivora]
MKKINVRLAVQILSESEIDQPNFGEASATAEFCMMMNQAFDILNSRNQFIKSSFNISINLIPHNSNIDKNWSKS